MQEAVFRTEDFPAQERFAYWTELMSRTHAPMLLSSDHSADYQGVHRTLTLGAVSVWPAVYQPHISRRTPKLIRQSDPEAYHLSLLLSGSGVASWPQGQVEYRPFDLYFNDTSQPHEVRVDGAPVKTVGVEIPKALVPLPRGTVERLIAHRMQARDGLGSLLGQFLIQLAAGSKTYRTTDGPRLATVLADLVTALFAHTVEAEDLLEPESRERALVLRIREFIRTHLPEPDLTPRTIAVAHHISLSYLHRIFAGETRTVAAEIRAQRLAAARRDLADAGMRDVPIHCIAARWGFPDAASFSRAHRFAHGCTPSEFRNGAQGRLCGCPGSP
ncbi:helix-turn-helix domain-containing protein [Streptomyces sp. NPDC058439]|uniref:AraC-like ligand-binding domain-containing protein n=1 Tax=Streptomyces sp. NPDC058439 TaxID=3346500 RepID=UPI00366505F5